MIQNVDFKGIVRGTSAQNNADGNCEEIINLRKKMGAWRVVGEKRKIVKDVEYEKVFLHECDSFKNYIGVKKRVITDQDPTGAPIIRIVREVEWFDPEAKQYKQTIYSTDSSEISLEQINNILLVKTEANIGKATFYKGKYTTSLLALPDCPYLQIRFDIEDYINATSDKKDIVFEKDWDNKYSGSGFADANQVIQGLYNKMLSKYPGYTEGYIMFSVAYKLYDGSVTKPINPYMLYVGKNTEIEKPRLHTGELQADNGILKDVYFTAKLHKLGLKPSMAALQQEFKDIIAGIVVYATKPINYFDFDGMKSQYIKSAEGKGPSLLPYIDASGNVIEGLPVKKIEEKDLQKQLFYEVAYFSVANGFNFEYEDIDFTNITAKNTMPVDASGWINTTGQMFIYNNRLHLFNVQQTFNVSNSISDPWKAYRDISDSGTRYNVTITTYLKGTTDNLVVNIPFNIHIKDIDGKKYFIQDYFSFPDSRAYKSEIVYKEGDKTYVGVIELKSSQTYNISFWTSPYCRIEAVSMSNSIYPKSERLNYSENNKIIVSDISNPFYFPPEHAYLVSGSIINIAVSSEQISSSQIGQFPLYVFTTQGIYAIEVGDGNVLYSNIIPISAEVAVAGSSVLQTRYGIVFVTKTGLKLIAGREVVDISQAIAGNPDISMQECETFGRVSEVVRGYDIRPYFSSVPFQDYIKEASLGYDINENEIIVSNPNYSYSYVYNLDEKTWHKITEVFTFFDKHLALRKGEGNLDLCDIREEISSDRLVHLQTRPLLFNTAAFKQIYHAVARGEFKPAENRIHLAYMLASNDLSKWICMAVRKTEINAPHISLPRAHQSFRYFSFIVGGYVRSGHLLTHAELEGEVKYGNRLR